MNEQNLINLADRTEEERREIAKKGGLASAEQRRLEREQIKDINLEKARANGKDLYSLIESYTQSQADIIVDYPHIVSYENGKPLYSSYYKQEGTLNEQIAINIVRHCLNYKDEEEKDNALKWTKLYRQIINDKFKADVKKQELQIKKELAIKELELKQRQLDLEERKVKAREELIKMKHRGVIDNELELELVSLEQNNQL